MDSEKDKAVAATIRKFFHSYATNMPPNNFDAGFVRAAELTSVVAETDTNNAKITYSLAIPPLCTNNSTAKTIHGGAVATFFDMATSMTIIACKNPWEDTGVTRNLNVTYFRPPMEGEQITIESEVLQLTKRLATVRGVMKRASDGAVLAICQHDKYHSSRVAPGKPKI